MVRLGRVTLIALVAALASCGSSAAHSSTAAHLSTTPPPPRHPPACGPAQASTLAFSAQARVYARRGVVFGCSVPSGRSFRLGTLTFARHRHLSGIYAVAGAVVAYAEVSFGVDQSVTSVLVTRLSDGALLGSYTATNTAFGEGFSSVGSLVVASGGAAAWIGQQTTIGPRGPSIEVLAASPSAANARVLDSGSTIAPKSLRLRGSTLSWRRGGSTRHATLP